MCTWITERAPMMGRGKGVADWIPLTRANVYYDHPVSAPLDHALDHRLRGRAGGTGRARRGRAERRLGAPPGHRHRVALASGEASHALEAAEGRFSRENAPGARWPRRRRARRPAGIRLQVAHEEADQRAGEPRPVHHGRFVGGRVVLVRERHGRRRRRRGSTSPSSARRATWRMVRASPRSARAVQRAVDARGAAGARARRRRS